MTHGVLKWWIQYFLRKQDTCTQRGLSDDVIGSEVSGSQNANREASPQQCISCLSFRTTTFEFMKTGKSRTETLKEIQYQQMATLDSRAKTE
jgi:hypothetical protein